MKGIITLQYRKIFDKNVQRTWDKYIFDDTHLEYVMKSQFYSTEHKTFKEILKAKPDAEKLHYLVSLAALNHLRALENLMPDVLNLVGNRCIPFENFKFEILQSHQEDKSKHRIMIDFFSKPLIWLDTIDNKMLLAVESFDNQVITETFMLELQPNLMICNFKSK